MRCWIRATTAFFSLHSLPSRSSTSSACRQLGCSRQQFLTLPMEKLFPEEAVEKVKALIKTGPADGKDQVTIITRLNKCIGGGIPVEILIRLVTFNRRLYGVAVARDITERQQAEQVLLENSRILRDMELARQIQLSLLPTATSVKSSAKIIFRLVSIRQISPRSIRSMVAGDTSARRANSILLIMRFSLIFLTLFMVFTSMPAIRMK